MVDLRKVIDLISTEATAMDASFYYIDSNRTLPHIAVLSIDTVEYLFDDEGLDFNVFLERYPVVDVDEYIYIPVTFKSIDARPISFTKDYFPDDGFASLMRGYIRLYKIKKAIIAISDLIAALVVAPRTLEVIIQEVPDVVEFFTGTTLNEDHIKNWVTMNTTAGENFIVETLLGFMSGL